MKRKLPSQRLWPTFADQSINKLLNRAALSIDSITVATTMLSKRKNKRKRKKGLKNIITANGNQKGKYSTPFKGSRHQKLLKNNYQIE